MATSVNGVGGAFASAFAKISGAGGRTEIENRFNHVQSTAIKRITGQIDGLGVASGQGVRRAGLAGEYAKLGEALPAVGHYIAENQTNLVRLQAMSSAAGEALGALSAGGDSAALDAEGLAAVNGARTRILAEIDDLSVLTHPGDAKDGSDDLARLKDRYDALAAAVPAAGDNRALRDLLTDVAIAAEAAAESTAGTVFDAVDLRASLEGRLAELQDRQADLDASAIDRRAQEADGIKARFGTLLQAVSASFAGGADTRGPGLAASGPGAVVNVFG